MRYSYAVLAGILILAGCQTMAVATRTDTGHLTHEFTDVRRSPVSDEPGYTHIYSFVEVFHAGDVGVHLTRSRICYDVEKECLSGTYDITVPANSSATHESTLLTYDPGREAYTETYFGRDDNGNDVVLNTHFRAADYF
jgi:hypothetical protein